MQSITSMRVVVSLISVVALASTPSKASEELLTTWAGHEIAECLSGNLVSIPGHSICIRKMSNEEVRTANYYRRLNHLKRLEANAEIDVRRGWDPSVSVGEFGRRLDRRSDIQEKIRDMEY